MTTRVVKGASDFKWAMPLIGARNMTAPEGKLTAAQFELLQLLWDSQSGLSVAEIWNAVRAKRNVSRTTILNLVDRLEKRGWLERKKVEGAFRYRAAVDRSATEDELATDFVSEFFNGSAEKLILSLLGSKRVSNAEIRRLKKLLADASRKADQRKGKKS
jgi:predicted transcriptional regulator